MEKTGFKTESTSKSSTEVDGEIQHGSSWAPTRISDRVKNHFWAIETTGIQRVTDEDRKENTTHVWNACTFW